MNDIFFVNENTGFIATGIGGITSSGNLYKTTNAGNNFSLVNTPVNNRFYAVRFLNSNIGFLADIDGNIFRTTDIGITWTASNTPQSLQSILDFQFINNNVGFAVGLNGYLLKTTDGGYNWNIHSRLNTSGLYRIRFINSLTGYITSGGGASGGMGEIFYSTNGGDNWNKTYLDLDVWNNILYSVDFANDSLGYVVGDNGILLKTTIGGIVNIKNITNSIPQNLLLHQNYPNPFNPTTKIKFDIAPLSRGVGSVLTTLKIYDILGKEITTLINEKLNPGFYEVEFDGSNFASGVYFYQLKYGDFLQMRKMILLK
jgi:photosystem II stability/assembly factor-like uncharacterized protein